MTQYNVTEVIAQWHELHPEFDLGPMEVWGRIGRLALLADQRRAEVLERYGLHQSDIGILAALYRYSGALRPRELRRWMLVASGTLTPRIDRLEKAGLVERRVAPDDRRGTVVQLTELGRSLTPKVVGELLQVEAGLLSPLPRRVTERLARDLTTLLDTLPDPDT